MRVVLAVLLLCVFYVLSVQGQCASNSDRRYDRANILTLIDSELKRADPYLNESAFPGYFVIDLANPGNRLISTSEQGGNQCIDFVDEHVYHFAPIDYERSLSHIAVLKAGKMKIFSSINCKKNLTTLADVIGYVSGLKLLSGNESADQITRLKNYRRFGVYRTVDSYRVLCNFDMASPPNIDSRYDRTGVLTQLAEVLRDELKSFPTVEFPAFPVEESKANGFFVYDLTDPSNHQVSLIESIEFKEGHVYHFGLIDAPFSYSNVAILQNRKVKIFRNLTCPRKGSSIGEIANFLSDTSELGIRRSVLMERLKHIRKYGVYSSLNGVSEPNCNE